MGVYEIQGPDGKVYEVEAPDMQTAAGAFSSMANTKDAPLPELPSVYSQFSQDLENPMGMGATLGASDAQLGDIVKKQLGDRFIRMEPAGEYQIAVTRGPDGKEQRGYINRPGLDSEDIVRGVRGSLPYFMTGGAAGLAARGAGAKLLGTAAAEGAAAAGTSVAGDIAQTPLGSEQGIEGGKALGAGLMGFGIPLAARAVGNAARSTREYFTPQTGPLADKSRKAVRNIADAIEADPSITPANVSTATQAFGPETMVADLGNTLQGDAAMLARTPIAKDVAADAIARRQAGAPARMEGTLNAEMGQARNLPAYISAQSKAYNANAKPFYDQFHASPVLASSNLKRIMARIPRSAYSEAERLARADGIKQRFKITSVDDPMTAMTGVQGTRSERVIQGVEYDYLKRAVDDLARNAKPGSNEQRIFSNLARDLRTEIDTILSPNDPSMSPWAIARSIAGEGLEGKEAAELGSQAFGNSPKDPHLVQADLAGMSNYGKDMYREGGRNKLRQVMGRAASNFGPKGDTAARRALNSEFSRENLDQIVGPGSAGRIGNRVDAENHFAKLHDMALGNSITDTMQASRQRWMPRSKTDFASEAGKKGPTGLATEYVMRLADALIGGQIRKAEVRAALDGAKILTAQGRERDDMVNALFRLINDRKNGVVTGQKFEGLARALLEGTRAPALQQQR